MIGHRPQPMAVGDEFLSLVLDELEKHGEVLTQIRDRLPEPAADGGPGEPAPGPAPVELREPASQGRLPEPRGNESRESWVAFARQEGAPEGELADPADGGSKRDELRAKYGTGGV
jgi:hypothetical protein